MSSTTRHSVFIDGQAGTTGLQIHQRLSALSDFDCLTLPEPQRKDPQAKQAIMAQADFVILCLHDDAARASVALIRSLPHELQPRVIDASTAHRVASDWVYGFAELSPEQALAIEKAQWVSNPGCYPTGGIALLRPLVDAGVLPSDYPIVMTGYSGYSGGGRALIEAYEIDKTAPPLEIYGLDLMHKHIPELQKYAGLTRRPIFVPAVGAFHSGLIDQIGLHLSHLRGVSSGQQLELILRAHYEKSPWVSVVSAAEQGHIRLEPTALNGTDKLELTVWYNDAVGQAVLTARFDNLGKGASGAAIQNLVRMSKAE
jgi:N-acetyl-gamma-glutamyl-phosphate reductase